MHMNDTDPVAVAIKNASDTIICVLIHHDDFKMLIRLFADMSQKSIQFDTAPHRCDHKRNQRTFPALLTSCVNLIHRSS